MKTYQKMKELRHSKEYEKGFRAGLKESKQFALMTKEEKFRNRKDEIRREIIKELTEQFKGIFGFITENDLEERMDRHYDTYHTP